MDEEDLLMFKRVEDEVRRLAALVERDLRSGTLKLGVDMYAVIYNAATRSKVGEVEQQYTAAQDLYQRFADLMTDVVVCRPLMIAAPQDSDAVFAAMIKKWTQFKLIQRWMLKTFGYLSRFYVLHCNKKPLDIVSLSIFYSLFKQHSKTIGKTLLNLFKLERKGEFVNKDDVRLGIELFNHMAVIEDGDAIQLSDFTDPFLRETRDFYKAEASRWIAECSGSEFLERADRCIKEESERAKKLLPPPMQTALIVNVEQQVLANHLQNFIHMPETGFVAMLRDWRTDKMAHAVQMISRLKAPGLDPLAQVLSQHCRQEGAAIVKRYAGQAEVDFKGYVSSFIELHEKYLDLLTHHLQGHVSFQTAIKEAFEATVNTQIVIADTTSGSSVTSSELISSYCDHLLRTGSEKMTDDELDSCFTKVVNLFLRVVDRDLFQEFLRKHLSRRLLTTTSVSDEQEKALISKFKAKCGTSFTSRLEGMLNDRSVSLQTSEQFAESEDGKRLTFDLSVQVLTMGFWPTFPEDTAIVPPSVHAALTAFSDFYLAKNKSKRLQWINSLGGATITGTWKKGVKELSMSVFQAAVLCLFNEAAQFTVEEMKSRTGLDIEELKRVLHSFSNSKAKLLQRTDEGTAIVGTSVFIVNEDFSSQQKKLKIPVAVQRIAAQAAQVAAAVEEDRRPAIDACIVRVMKSRKQMEHTLLVASVIDLLQNKFRPDPKMIKLRIEDLINREYLERMPDRPNTYVYLA